MPHSSRLSSSRYWRMSAISNQERKDSATCFKHGHVVERPRLPLRLLYEIAPKSMLIRTATKSWNWSTDTRRSAQLCPLPPAMTVWSCTCDSSATLNLTTQARDTKEVTSHRSILVHTVRLFSSRKVKVKRIRNKNKTKLTFYRFEISIAFIIALLPF